MWQPHIVGGKYGDDEVLFTYCVMTNLPVPFVITENPGNYKVLAQTNSNLLMWDTESNEIIQQITQKCEFSEKTLTPLPIEEMTWGNYKKLYPNGVLLHNEWTRPMEKILDKLFSVEETLYGEDFMFKTVNLEEDKLPSKEHIIGVRDHTGENQIAFSKDFLRKKGVFSTTLGTEEIVVVHYPEYDIFKAFNRTFDGRVLTVEEIDVNGVTPDGKQLEQVFLYHSPFWAVWVTYFPKTEVYN